MTLMSIIIYDNVETMQLTRGKSFNLSEVLAERYRLARRSPKRRRTRLKLIAAAAAELDRVGYDEMTVEGIVDAADVARGTFYTYYRSKAAVTVVIIRIYSFLIRWTRPIGGGALPPFQAILRMNRFYVSTYAKNARLQTSRETLMRTVPALRRLRDNVTRRTSDAFLRDIISRKDLSPTFKHDTSAVLLTRMLQAMADETLRQIYVYPDEHIAEQVKNEEQVAQVISVIWYRMIYASEPENHALTADGLALLKMTASETDAPSVSGALETKVKQLR